MNRHPSHGYPGGPPIPPYGDTTSTQTPLPPPPVESPPSDSTTTDSPRRSTRMAMVAAVVAASCIAALIAVMFVRLSRPDTLRDDAAAQEQTDQQSDVPSQGSPGPDPTPPPLAPPSDPPPVAGARSFIAAPIEDCVNMTSSIGASNEFLSGLPTAQAPRVPIESSGMFTDPVWVAQVPESVQRQDLLGDTTPPLPSIHQAVSDNHVLLFNPLDVSVGSRVGTYRSASGELVWSASIAPGVYPVIDNTHMYLIDLRDDEITRVAILSPSLGQTMACYAAAGSPSPQPSPDSRSAVAANGVIYLSYDSTLGPTIQALSQEGTWQVSSTDTNVELHGVVVESDKSLLIASSGIEYDLSLRAFDTQTGDIMFDKSLEDLVTAPRPVQWGEGYSSRVAANADGLRHTAVVAALTSSAGILVAVETNGDAVRLVSLTPDGTAMWSAPARRGVVRGWSTSGGFYHLLTTEPLPSGEPPAAVIVAAQDGSEVALTDVLRSSGMGTDLVGYVTFNPDIPVVIYNGANVAATFSGPVSSMSPVALDGQTAVIYCEFDGSKYLVAYVINPEGSDGPQA